AIALGMGSILVGISIDYVFHIFTHAQNGHGIRQLFKDISTPIFISALTTAAAFFGLLFISSGALRDMGLFAGISILFAAIFSLILIPLFLPNFREEKLKENKMKDWLMPLFHYPFHQDKVLIIILLLLTPILYHFSKQVRFEGDLNAINYMPKKLKIAESKLNDISSVSQRNVFLVSRASTLDSALLNAEQMNLALDEIQKSGIDLSVAKIQNFLPSEELQKVRLKRWNKFWNEDRKNQLKNNLSKIEQTYGFKQNTFTDFTKTLDEQFETMNEIDRALIQQDLLKEFIHKYKNGYSVLTQIKVSNSQREDLQQALQKTSFKDSVIDKQFLATGFLDALKADFKLLVTITMLLVFGIILLSFGRIELSIITFLPMSLSWIWTLGIMALLNIPFNIVNIIISTLIFGLGIDYSIFITNGLVKEYASGKKVLYSFKTSIFFSSLTTILGIGVLLFAQHPALKSMALVTVIGLLSVLLIAFTIQPWLFNWLINTKDKQRVLPMTLSDFIGSIFTFVIFLLGTFMSTIIGFVLIKLIPGKSENLRFIFHKTIQLSSKFIVYILVHIPKKIVGLDKDKFRKPAVIISNHQSHIDIVLLLMLHPKMILLTNDWVQKNPFYGALVRMAEFYPVLDRLEENLPLIEAKVKKGYSIMIFPEGSRSADSKIKRFHKGAFYLAEKLELDILPVLLHGVGDCITKGENFLKRGQIHVKILNRISPHDLNFGSGYVSRSKSFRQFYLKQFELLKQEVETPLYFRRKLINNYIYKGPVLEWYARIKTRFDNNYSLFNELIPKEAKIVDIGCGYGFMAYMLHFLSDKRTILGIDYDEEKIEVAQHIHAANYLAKDQVQFISGDAQSIDFGKADAFVLSDVLHYLPYNEQEKVLINCICNLEPNGQIIIREADSNHKKHQGTRFSEWQSTKLIGFNKTSTDDKALFFTSKERLVTFFNAQKCTLQVIDTTKLNSNLIYIARKA
ncbi:MAG: 1-acyl-sn-glycerol-3-phosphate acyltransferase, partial [Bacteroidales bacterium]|nr:1-acyl-sn-glycerol-3-phosphate acyltransferase [Bacteroidales bacterium]